MVPKKFVGGDGRIVENSTRLNLVGEQSLVFIGPCSLANETHRHVPADLELTSDNCLRRCFGAPAADHAQELNVTRAGGGFW